MAATLLAMHRVEKPWGRRDLWPGFPDADLGKPVGEVWFDAPYGVEPDLMIKYIFTSEKLSVQVHPNDIQAREAGFARGKDECWIVLAAEPGATIGLGTIEPLDKAQLRAAALDGSIARLVDWRPVKAGDFLYSPAGTVHAIGAGLTIIEIQQNVDLTYRLYDYGRPRELHLDEAVEASVAKPFEAPPRPENDTADRVILTEGPKFVVERWPAGVRRIALPPGKPGWLIPVAGEGVVDGVAWLAGQCLFLEGTVQIEAADDSDLLFAYAGDRRL